MAATVTAAAPGALDGGSCGLAALLGGDMVMVRHFSILAAALESIEGRAGMLATRLAAAEAQTGLHKARLAEAEGSLAAMATQLDASNAEQQGLKREVSRLAALLDAAKLQASLSSEALLADLADERRRSERLRAVRDDALLQRDDALLELANAYADIDAMQATLADSALYVRQLRRRVSELEAWQAQQHQQHQQAAAKQHAAADRQAGKDQGVFSLASIQASIQAAVAAAAQQPEAERKKRIRQLQLRWHPDKNPVLREFATEVTKIINEAVSKLEAQK